MPEAVGYPVKLRRSQKWIEERARVEDLWTWAREFRTASRETKWRRSERQYMGQHFEGIDGNNETENDQITVNMSFSTVNTIVPYITGSEPSFYIEPFLAPASKRAATMLKSWLNRTWRHHDVNGQEHLEVSATDSLILGDGFMEVLWELVSDDYDPDSLEAPVEKARIWVERVSPWDAWVDPYADGLHNARFVAIRKTLPISVIQEDSRYRYTEDLSADSAMPDSSDSDKPTETRNLSTSDVRDDLVDLIEFYDITSRTLVSFVAGMEMPLRVVEGISLPVFQLKNYRIPRSPYGMSELEQLWSLQLELNKTRSQMITHRRRNLAKYLARRGTLQQDAIDAIKSEELNEIIWIDGSGELTDVIAPLDLAQLTGDAYQVSDIITRDIYEISGVNEYLRGATPSISRTATEATIIETASNVKSTYKLRQIEKFVRKVGQQMLDIASDVFPMTEVGEFAMVISGREAQELAGAAGDPDPSSAQEGQMILTADLFQGKYEVFVETNSTEMRNPRFRAEQYKDVINTLAPLSQLMMQMGQAPPDLSKIIEMWLEALGVENIDAILSGQQPMPPEMAGAMGGPSAGGGSNPAGTQPGAPNIGNMGAPSGPLSNKNTGAFPPA